MTISSSLNAGIAGLAANASRLSTIADNIANSSTFGYKRVVADFHSMVIQGGPGKYIAGGVRATTQRLIDERGPLLSTSNSTDLAVRGRGMLPVTNNAETANGRPPLLLTSTGSFRPDSEGYLRSTSGLVLMGWPANADGSISSYSRDTQDGLQPIIISSNQFFGKPTTEMRIAVNLPATSTDAGKPVVEEELSLQYYDNLGKPERLSVSYVPTVPAAGAPSNEWTMIIRDSASGGAEVGRYTLTFDATRGSGGTLASVATTTGGPFNAATGIIQITVAGGPIDVKLGLLGSPNGLTQLSDKFAPIDLKKNGAPAGNLTGVEVDEKGFVRAFYDSGVTRTLYQVPLIDVPNQNGLRSMNDQTYAVTQKSGPMFMWDAGEGPTGDIVGYAREESTTDIAVELTQLIQTQRAYSSNAKIVQTVDEMLQETTNLKR
jgi:flagellar hook protein FlgE